MTLAGRLVGGTVAILLVAVLVLILGVDRAVAGDVLLGGLVAVIGGAVIARVAGRKLARALSEVGDAARTIAGGGQPRFPHTGIPEVDGLARALREMHQELVQRFDDLHRRQAESEALVNAMVEGVLAADRRGRIVTANPAARRLLGYADGRALPELQTLFRGKEARAVVAATLDGKMVADREIDLDGRTCILSARPLPEGGAVLVLHDLTQIRRLEAIRRDFVANVSHELKTPLTSISGYAETLLTDHPEPETTRRFLETILTNAQRMQRLVDDQLDLSRIEAGHWQPAPQPVDAAAALRDAWLASAERVPGREGDLRFEVTVEPAAEIVTADPEALRQVLTNLYENSRRYTPPGGLITAAARRDGEGIRISVTDTGSGIAGEHLPRIFERFYRADPSRSRGEGGGGRGGGTGLGLAIVKHSVEAHGGRVWAESTLGQGTTIHCWFPLEPDVVTQT